MSSSGLDVGTRVYLKRRVAKPSVTDEGVGDTVRKILDGIREGGEAAVSDLCRRFDKWDGDLVVSKGAIDAAAARVPERVRRDIEFAHERIQAFAMAQKGASKPLEVELAPGMWAGHQVIPVKCAGCYVPGGRFAHVASALMTVTTARAADVQTIVACSPPRGKEGIHPAVLYAFKVAGADYVLTMGGVQALASMAFGLFTGHTADIIVGPGNRFVVEAKRQLFGEIGIDLIAGPTEVAVLADDSADAHIVATDLVSQAEHGPDSPAVLITNSRSLGEDVLRRIPALIAALPEANRVAEVSWRDYGEIIVVDTRDEMVQVSDEVASEHLEVQCKDLDWWKRNLRNYGSLFLGEETTVSFGDKTSGPNHVLPTRNASRYTGGLYVGKFLKTVSWQRMTREATRDVATATARISRMEGMEGHAKSADVRLEKYFPGENFELSVEQVTMSKL